MRYNTNNAWYVNGSNGTFDNNNMYNSNQSVPVSNFGEWVRYWMIFIDPKAELSGTVANDKI